MAVIYRHIGLDNNEIFYIGISSNKSRPYNTDNRSDWWKNYVKKHGRVVEILAKDVELEEAKEIEAALISHYGRRDLKKGPLLNMTDGGEGCTGYKHTKEALQKLRIARRKRVITEETKRKISESNKGNRMHKNTAAAIRKANLGSKRSDETRAKMSEAGSGERNAMYGKKHSEEARAKMSIAKSKPRGPQEKKTCPHCGLVGAGPNMTRYHFNKCKLKN